MRVNGRSSVLFEQLIQSQPVDDFPLFYKPRFSLLYTKQPTNGPYTRQDEPNQYSSIPF